MILKMEAEGSSEPLTCDYWATPPHVSEARTLQESRTADTAERRLTLLPPTCHQQAIRELWVCRNTWARFDSRRWYTHIHVMRGVWPHLGTLLAGSYADRRQSWKDRMLEGYRRSNRVYSPARAQDRHTSMKTSNRSHRTLLSSDKNSGAKGSLYALFLARSPTNVSYTRRMKTVTQFYNANYTYAL